MAALTGMAKRADVEPELGVVGATVARNFGSLAAGRLGSQLLGLVTNAYVGRRISVEGFGMVGLAQAVTTYLNIFSDAGLSVIAIRDASQRPGQLQQLLRSISALRLLLGTVIMLAGLGCAGFLPFSETSRQMVRIFALSLPLQAIGVDWVFRALQKMHFSAGVQVLGAAMTLPLTLLFVHSANDALRIPAINLAVVAMSGGASVIVARRLGLRYGLDFDVAAFRGHLAASIPLCASSLAITLYIQANYLILGGVRGEEEVGFYAAAARLTSALSTVHWLYYAAMAPALTSLYSQSTAQAAALLKESLRLTAVAGLGACVLGVSVADRLVPLVFGPTFTGGGAVLSVMLLSAAVVAIGHNWAQMVIAAKRERLLLASTLAGGVCNLAVCALLVRPLGALGTAVANLAAEVLVHAVLLIFCWKRLGMAEVGAVGKPALAATVGLVVAVAPLGVVSRAVLACSVYVALLVLTRALSVADVHAVVRIVRGTGSRTEGTWQ